VKGTNFVNLRDAGDPVELATAYAAAGADELVFLDITATIDKRKTLAALVERIAAVIDIPFTVGGGISSTADVRTLLQAGADKVSLNSAAVARPELISEIADTFGNQCLVVAIDAALIEGVFRVVVHGGRTPTVREAGAWAEECESRGAGEILLTSMRRDGSREGFDIELTRRVGASTNLPIIASGGGGSMDHFKQVFQETEATGALAASVFHFQEIDIPELKSFLKTAKIPVR
jgi:cyclase